jgi:DNA polymerase elongation subunit (family B)
MSYVDAVIEREKNQILVAERDKNGNRILVTHPTKYVVYWPSERGKYRSIFGTKLDKFQTNKQKEFQREVSLLPKTQLHESDINPIFRCLYDNYKNVPTTDLHVGFFDIETAFDPEQGFSSTEDAFSPITAISIYLNWLDKNFTLVIKPDSMSKDAAQSIVDDFEDTLLCDSEKQLLETFLDLIEDVDILSGWNSEGYDIPYIHNRIIQVLGKDETRRLCLWGKFPRKREYEAYGRETITYDLVGRVHLDYLQLYRKNTYHEMHSYRLDFVGEYEVGEKKTQYDGTLDQLYNSDFKKFIEYNKQDVMLLVKIDKKKKFIDLANNLAHENCVLLQTTMGAVALIDQGIVNAAHDMDLMVPTRIRETELEREERWAEETEMGGSVVGAYVADPKPGLHDWLGGVDITSLYPSVIRALNMSPETIVGQIRPILTDAFIKLQIQQKKSFADSWNSVFGTLEYQDVMEQKLTPLQLDFEDGSEAIVTAKEIYELVFKSGKKLAISANGTIFDYSKMGLIPGVLTKWFAERKELQREYKKWDNLYNTETDPDKKAEYKKQSVYYDMMQLIKKVLLNSLYGAVGNPGSRWFDQRIAQSTTLSGRCIVKHQGAKINETITGEYDYTGQAIVYGDTDSTYFSAHAFMKALPEFADYEWSKENVISLYDQIADITNQSFPAFLEKAFGVTGENGKIIKANRELCAIKGLFITKKRYAVLIFDKEGKRKDINGKPGEIKAMGLDLKRSDTPKVVQDFLSDILTKVLTGVAKSDIIDDIKAFRTKFRSWQGWEQGSPKRANNVTKYTKMQTSGIKTKTMIPGHVLASINWNKLKKIYGDHYSTDITDGQKVIVCKLKPNPSDITSIAYPVDQMKLPDWFKELPFDSEAMESALIDKKVDNLLNVLNWDLSASKDNNNFASLFEF